MTNYEWKHAKSERLTGDITFAEVHQRKVYQNANFYVLPHLHATFGSKCLVTRL